jgi:hypothetical protein
MSDIATCDVPLRPQRGFCNYEDGDARCGIESYWRESDGFGTPKRDEPSRNGFENVSAFKSGLCNGHHDHSGELLSTLFSHVASDRLGKPSYRFMDSVLFVRGVLERVHHVWFLRLASSNFYEELCFPNSQGHPQV